MPQYSTFSAADIEVIREYNRRLVESAPPGAMVAQRFVKDPLLEDQKREAAGLRVEATSRRARQAGHQSFSAEGHWICEYTCECEVCEETHATWRGVAAPPF